MRIGERREALQELAAAAPADINVFQAVGELIRHLPQTTIVKLAGKARGGGAEFVAAADMAFAADLFDAEAAASYGWINRAVPADELDEYVDRVARHIAALPDGVVEAAKRALPADDFKEGLLRENDAWATTISLPAAQRLIGEGLRDGAQTPARERDLEGLRNSSGSRTTEQHSPWQPSR